MTLHGYVLPVVVLVVAAVLFLAWGTRRQQSEAGTLNAMRDAPTENDERVRARRDAVARLQRELRNAWDRVDELEVVNRTRKRQVEALVKERDMLQELIGDAAGAAADAVQEHLDDPRLAAHVHGVVTAHGNVEAIMEAEAEAYPTGSSDPAPQPDLPTQGHVSFRCTTEDEDDG